MNAIVTGAAHGLGAAIAKRLTEDGLGVALVDVAGSVTEQPKSWRRAAPR